MHLSKTTGARNMQKIKGTNTLIDRANDKLTAIKKAAGEDKHGQRCTLEEKKDTLESWCTFKREDNIDISCMSVLFCNFKIKFC